MKKIITPLMALFVAVACQAQESHLDQFYQKFDAAGVGTTKGSINLALLFNLGATDSSDSWMKKVTMCRFLALEPEKSSKAGQEWSDLTRSLKDDNFEEWMSVRKGKSNLKVMSRDRKDGQEDVVCVAVDEHGEGVFFHLRGRFTAADRAHIREMMRDHDGGLGGLTVVKNSDQ